jgi:hypothetical protein
LAIKVVILAYSVCTHISRFAKKMQFHSANMHSAILFEVLRYSAYSEKALCLLPYIRQRRTVSFRVFGKGAQQYECV